MSRAHPYLEYHVLLADASDRVRNLALLRQHRQPITPFLDLTGLDEAKRREVVQNLGRWYEASQQLMGAQYLEAKFEAGGRVDPAQVTAWYQKALAMNSGDNNAQFLYRHWTASYQALLARESSRRDDQRLTAAHLRAADEACPESEAGAEARFELSHPGAGRLAAPQ